MMDLQRIAARTIDSQRTALAEAIVARQYELQPELQGQYGETGRDKCVQDTAYHLAYLSASLVADSPVLFADYYAWAKTVMAARGIRVEDVASTLDCMREILTLKLPGEVGTLAVRHLDMVLSQVPDAPAEPPTFLGGDDALSDLARKYLDALLKGQRHAASRLVQAAVDEGTGISDLYLQVFQRCQREVGRLWQLNRISVAQEHYCSAATQLVMSQLYEYLFVLPRNGHRLVAACVAGDLHEIGLRIVTDLFEMDGWDTLYLGASMPPGSVVQALAGHRAEVLLVSVTMAYHLSAVEELIQAVRSSEATAAVKVVVGGLPFRVAPELWRRVEADGSASDANEALELVGRLLNLQEPPRRRITKNDREDKATAGLIQPGPIYTGGDATLYNELSRENSELVTLQRELVKKNRRTEQELVHAWRVAELGELASALAHELNQPLTAILTNAQATHRFLASGRTEFGELGEALTDIIADATRAGDLLRKLRNWFHRGELVRAPVDINEAIREVEAIARVDAVRNGVTLILDLTPGLSPIEGDALQLQQVVLNLLRNASETMKDTDDFPREVVVRTLVGADGGFEVTVSDRGPPVNEEVFSRMFDSLFTTKPGGMGVGLTISRSIVAAHGGRLWATRNADRGLTLHLSLPR